MLPIFRGNSVFTADISCCSNNSVKRGTIAYNRMCKTNECVSGVSFTNDQRLPFTLDPDRYKFALHCIVSRVIAIYEVWDNPAAPRVQ